MRQWMTLVEAYSGWSLNDIKSLSVRERLNWLEAGRELGKVTRNG